MGKILEIKDLSMIFGKSGDAKHAVQGMGLQLEKGEVLGIVGESGSGKSVTVMSILSLLHPSAIVHSGSIFFDPDGPGSIDLLKADEPSLRRFRGGIISIIFQEPMSALNPVRTCGQQVEEVLIEHKKCEGSMTRKVVCNWFEKTGLQNVERIFDSYPHELSGGQLQRVLIALALCCEPQIVIADEPTTALDVNVQKKILDLLKQLQKELHLSLIFISHDLGVIRYLCDRVLVMKDGKKIEENSCKHIFENPSHPYTKGLILSRPPLRKKLKQLPTVEDILKGCEENWFDDTNIVNSTEQDRKCSELQQLPRLIGIRNLNVRYPRNNGWFFQKKNWHYAVKDVSLDIFQGEVVGLVGESGSGKTSLGRAILGLAPVSSGEIYYRDQRLDGLSSREWRLLRKKLQIIFQDPYSALNPRRTILDSISQPLMIHHIVANRSAARQKASELMEMVGLSSLFLDRYPHQFSGGQRQRICIARALSLNPEFIACDESVSALDVSVQAQILNLLMDLKNKLGLSLLFITHDLSVVQYIADRIIVLNHGELVEEGKPYQIIGSPVKEYTQNLVQSVID